MAVPKKKKSKSKRNQRHAVWKGKAAIAAQKAISLGKNELIMVPIIIIFIEIVIRIKPAASSKFYYLWTVVDKLRIGAIYAVILEAFKLGS